MLRRSTGRSSGSPKLGQRGCGGLRRLPSPAVASRRWRRSRPPLGPARCRIARRWPAPVEPSLPRTELRRSGNCLRGVSALPTSAQILVWTTISLVSKFFFKKPVIRCRVGRGANGCCPACGGNHGVNRSGWGEGWRFLRERRDSVSRCREGRGGLHVSPVEGGVVAAVATVK